MFSVFVCIVEIQKFQGVQSQSHGCRADLWAQTALCELVNKDWPAPMDENGKKRLNENLLAQPTFSEVINFYAEEIRSKLKDSTMVGCKKKRGRNRFHPGRANVMLTIFALLTQLLKGMRFECCRQFSFRIPHLSFVGFLGIGLSYIILTFLALQPEPKSALNLSGLVESKDTLSYKSYSSWGREEIPNQPNITIPPELYPEVKSRSQQPLVVALNNLPVEMQDQPAVSSSPPKAVKPTRKIVRKKKETKPKRSTANGIFHVVRARENLWDIAQGYHVSHKKVVAANPYINPSRLMPGDKVFVPGAKLGSGKNMISPLPPGAKIISGYGFRKHPIGGSIRFHEGIDLPANRGTPVRAVLDGKVAYASRHYVNRGKGRVVEIQHKNGLKTVYAHNSKIHCRKGDYVKQGEIIAEVGSTGRTTGPHLHFEVWEKGKHRDPEQYLPKIPNHPRRRVSSSKRK